MATSRQSQAPGAIASAAATAKLLEKKKEYEAVAALERASAQFLKRIEDIADDFDVIADAGIGERTVSLGVAWSRTRVVHGQVLEQWPNMFRILSLFCTLYPPLECCRSDRGEVSQREQQTEDESAPAPTTGERLVRVPIEELRQAETKTT